MKNNESIQKAIQYVLDYEQSIKALSRELGEQDEALQQLKNKYKDFVINNEIEKSEELQEDLQQLEDEIQRKSRRFAVIIDTLPEVIQVQSKKIAKHAQLLELEYQEKYEEEANNLLNIRNEYREAKSKVLDLRAQYDNSINYADRQINRLADEYNVQKQMIHNGKSAGNTPFYHELYTPTGEEIKV